MMLTDAEKAILGGAAGTVGDRMALEVVTEAARMLGADRLIEIHSSHIDGCLYHGDSGALYCEKLAENGARVKVPATTNVGALNLLNPDQCRLPPDQRKMAYRLMVAHERMGCVPSWTCAPYQAGARPSLGQQVAWGESNAVAFTNTVLGARTNRYGDFLDIACAISARAPYYGLHKPENRHAKLVLDVAGLSPHLLKQSAFYPVLGSIIGRLAGETVCAVTGLPQGATDDELKALCAGAASTGAVALTHIVGVTPEAPDLATALGGGQPEETVTVSHDMIIEARNRLSLAQAGPIDSVALGSPHFSTEECKDLLRLADGAGFKVPVYICLGRHTLSELEQDGSDQALRDLGVVFVVDTCVVVTPILPDEPGVMMTNSAKFAHYATGNTGHLPVFGTLADCVVSAQQGRVVWDQEVWA
ncbi:MAG: aconitase X catalytic domain-containing protein [Rhodobacteraceae bacterium]|nr:aconitase X catalytic domain-containing protein [Paracoccaceae bacterium]